MIAGPMPGSDTGQSLDVCSRESQSTGYLFIVDDPRREIATRSNDFCSNHVPQLSAARAKSLVLPMWAGIIGSRRG